MTKLYPGNIIPRWEWRTFGNDFGQGEINIRKYACTRAVESREVYILSNRSENNCKIRGELIDIKILEKVNADSLEQWMPVLKVSFPVTPNEIDEVLRLVGIGSSNYERIEYTIEQFLREVVETNRDLQIVNVFKKRYGWLINNAIVEIADLTINGESIRTLAVEHVDPDLVINTVRRFHLDIYKNINYIRGLKNLKGME